MSRKPSLDRDRRSSLGSNDGRRRSSGSGHGGRRHSRKSSSGQAKDLSPIVEQTVEEQPISKVISPEPSAIPNRGSGSGSTGESRVSGPVENRAPGENRMSGSTGENRTSGSTGENRMPGSSENRPSGSTGESRMSGSSENHTSGSTGENRMSGSSENRASASTGENRMSSSSENRTSGSTGENRVSDLTENRASGSAGENRMSGSLPPRSPRVSQEGPPPVHRSSGGSGNSDGATVTNKVNPIGSGSNGSIISIGGSPRRQGSRSSQNPSNLRTSLTTLHIEGQRISGQDNGIAVMRGGQHQILQLLRSTTAIISLSEGGYALIFNFFISTTTDGQTFTQIL